MSKSNRILGIDFGLKRIGIAIGDTDSGNAQPLTCITANKSGPDWNALQQIIDEWRPFEIVVGLPLTMDGQESPMSALVRNFARQLYRRCNINVSFMDERLTSVAAADIVRQATPKGKKVKSKSSGLIDSIAAQLIVESYLRENRARNPDEAKT